MSVLCQVTVAAATLLLVPAPAQAATGCSAAEGCAAASGRGLLQKAKPQAILETSRLGEDMSSLHLQLELVEGLVEMVAKQGGKLSPNQTELVLRLNASFFNQTMPEITMRHVRDQRLLISHKTAVENCDNTLVSNSQTVASLNSTAGEAETAMHTAQSEETELESASETATAALSSFLTGLVPPNITMPTGSATEDAWDAWVATNLIWYENANRTYETLKVSSSSAEALAESKSSELSTKTTSFVDKYCSWAEEMQLVRDTYANCREATISLFNSTKDTAISNMDGRKTDYIAILKVECLIRVLLAADADATTLAACSSATHSTAALDISVPELPGEDTATLSSLGTVNPAIACPGESGDGDGESTYGEPGYDVE